MKLSNKKAIVTGGSASIGRAIARRLAAEGAFVLISYQNNQQGADETVAMIEKAGGQALAVQADFSSTQGVQQFGALAIDKLGSVDVLINNAGIAGRAGFHTTPEEFAQLYQINTFAPFVLSQCIAQHMIEQNIAGSIVHISSIAVDLKRPSLIAYASSKAAINTITECSALHLAEYNIRVNAVAPGVIGDGMNAERLANDPSLHEHYAKIIPLGRTGKAEDIANMIAFLVSDEASWITGKIFDVDGGYGTASNA